ncbi:MAG: nitroreductase [Deltaproteobacteria bacterium]|nr:MAG: nitroreductase [Deltaproteobacteria bacterium]
MSAEYSPLEAVVRARRSVRGFKPDPVPQEVLREALEMAQWAPSNCNVQPWRVTIASGEARDRLSKAMVDKFYSGAFDPPDHPVEIFHDEYRTWQVDCAKRLYGEMGVERHDKEGRICAMARNYELFDAPHVAIVCMDKKFGVGTALTVGMWMQTFMLALTERGVDTCAMAAMRSYADTIRTTLDIPENHAVLCGIAIGYEDVEVPANRTRQPRGPLEDNVAWRS